MSTPTQPAPPRPPAAGPKIDALEYLRGLAAFYVFVHHLVHLHLKYTYPWLSKIFVFGQTAVMLFFILSGFVVYYSSVGTPGGTEVRPYLIRRFRRIYPPLLVALLIGFVARWIRGRYDPDLHNLVGNLLMLHDRPGHPGSWFDPYAGNSPLWSLPYEWWFYVVFIALFSRAGSRPERLQYWAAAIGAVGFVGYQIFPNQPALYLAYFPLWWSGAELAREYMEEGKLTWRRQAFSFGVVAALTVAWGAVRALTPDADTLFGYPGVQVRHHISVLAMLVGGMAYFKAGHPGFRTLLRPLGTIAPVSYALYVIHEPMIQAARDRIQFGGPWLPVAVVVPIIFAVAWLTEKPLQRRINKLLPAR
ncbi:MAG: acyltransferase [Myxococcales bacterium]|nr:acyltransferase [Myxococcales bacterium]MCB9520771.1 acyltransferase [Myxococcales bacterium]MCB9533488.1 acyltransferase [Myxococcales bacterium]